MYSTKTGHFHNGVLPLTFGNLKASVIGGPYDNFPEEGFFGVCVRKERMTSVGEFDVWLPIQDFHVPDDYDEVVEALNAIVDAIFEGQIVYIGCLGGMGRTGLIMALLAKASGEPNPVAYVREHYYEKAVETTDQKLYVEHFDVEPVASHIAALLDGLNPAPAPAPLPTPEPRLRAFLRAFRDLFRRA